MRDLKYLNNIIDNKEDEIVNLKVRYEQKIMTLSLKLEEKMYCKENLVEELSSSFRRYNQIFKNESDVMRNNLTTRNESALSITNESYQKPVRDLRNIVNSIDLKLSKEMGLNCDSKILTNESFD